MELKQPQLLIDASFVKAPVQRNTPDENDQIKSGEAIDAWSENKRRQKDTDARWTKKGDKAITVTKTTSTSIMLTS